MLMDCINVFYVLPVQEKKKDGSFTFYIRQQEHFSSFQLVGIIPCVYDFMSYVLKYSSSEI